MPDRLLVNVFNLDAAVIVARARGLFSANGLDVEVMATPNSTDQMRGLSRGSWEIVSTAFDNVLGWSGREGVEIVAVAQIAQGISLPVFVRPEIQSWADLRGKPLAVDAVDTAYALVLRRILLAHGLDLDRNDYRLLPKGATGHRLDSMKQKETFAGILNPPWDAQAVAAGMLRFGDHREVLPEYPGGVFAVGRLWAGDYRDLLVRFLRAWEEARAWASDSKNHDQVIRIIAEAEKLEEKAAAHRLRQLPKNGQLNITGLRAVLDLRVQFGLTPTLGTELMRYYDESFYRDASRK
ncbi:MAG TPA: ABC transporter substrate-binding protein [Candidatus Binatia bacterium]|nr:ABC transporter substrate-binding protein [Candidatus Binatia bacterium]